MVTIITLIVYTHSEQQINSNHMKIFTRIRITFMWKCLRHIAIFWSLTITKIFENTICYLCRHKILTQKKIFFSIWVFFHNHSQITGLQLKGEDISLTPNYHFHSLDRHLDISRAITAKSSPLHIGSSWTRTRNLWFPSPSR